MTAVFKAMVFALGYLLFIPILLAAYWWISLPVYYSIVALQFRSARAGRTTGTNSRSLFRLACIQAGLPLLAVFLYPIMPGRTATNEPLGLDEKAYLSVAITLVVMIGCMITFALKARRLRKTERIKPDAGVFT